MYKGASQNLQTRLDRRVVPDAAQTAGRQAYISDHEARENFRRAIADLEHKICSLPKGSPARAALGKRKRELQLAREKQRKTGAARANSANSQRVFQIFKEIVFGKFEEAQLLWDKAKEREAEERAAALVGGTLELPKEVVADVQIEA